MMTLVFERFPYGGNERVLALALADHAHDDGSHIYPGNELLAKKCLISERTVMRLINKFMAIGWLIKITQGNIGRGISNEYIINPDWIKGDNLSPFLSVDNSPISVDEKKERVTNEAERVTNPVLKGDIAVSPQQYNHQLTITPKSSPELNHAAVKILLAPLGINFYNQYETVDKWVSQKLSKAFLSDCVAIARKQKPLPQKIPANYLDTIIQSRMSGKRNLSIVPKPEIKPPASKQGYMPSIAWLLNEQSTMEKGKELGIPPHTGESITAYRERLKKALALKNQTAASSSSDNATTQKANP